MTGIALSGIDHVVSLTAVGGGLVHWRTYFVHLKRGAPGQGKVPRVELSPMGPYLDLQLRRTHFPSADLEKASLRKPKQCVHAGRGADGGRAAAGRRWWRCRRGRGYGSSGSEPAPRHPVPFSDIARLVYPR